MTQTQTPEHPDLQLTHHRCNPTPWLWPDPKTNNHLVNTRMQTRDSLWQLLPQDFDRANWFLVTTGAPAPTLFNRLDSGPQPRGQLVTEIRCAKHTSTTYVVIVTDKRNVAQEHVSQCIQSYRTRPHSEISSAFQFFILPGTWNTLLSPEKHFIDNTWRVLT